MMPQDLLFVGVLNRTHFISDKPFMGKTLNRLSNHREFGQAGEEERANLTSASSTVPT
jgi:hypothetical protein